MGGYGSGRWGGRPTADSSLRIDLAWMLRAGYAKEGCISQGTLRWTCGGQSSGSISYLAAMQTPGHERLELSFMRPKGDGYEKVHQTIRLCYTRPHFGGKRWWMLCPGRGIRVAKLYLPPGGNQFLSRQALGLGYHSQRIAKRDKPFESLFRLQKKLGCDQGWEAGIYRPKGMWHKTFERHHARYWELDAECTREMIAVLGHLP